MSMSWLRSMSPLHLQYLKNMGVTATLVASLVREGHLWGLISCHHYSPKRGPLRGARSMRPGRGNRRHAHRGAGELHAGAHRRDWCGGSRGGSSKRPPRTASGSAHCWTIRAACCGWSARAARCSSTTTSCSQPAMSRRRRNSEPLVDWVADAAHRERRLRLRVGRARRAGARTARRHRERRAGGRALAPGPGVSAVAARRAGAGSALGRQSAQAGAARQRSARAVAAPLVRGVDRAGPRHRAAVVAGRSSHRARGGQPRCATWRCRCAR